MMMQPSKEEAKLLKKYREAKTAEEKKKIAEEISKIHIKNKILYSGPLCRD